MTKRKSTGARAETAWKRLVIITRRKGLPRWATAGAATGAVQSPKTDDRGWSLTGRESDTLLTDYRTVEDAMGRIPWEWARHVPGGTGDD